MKTILRGTLLVVVMLSSCVSVNYSTMADYMNHDFHHTFRKYLSKDGYVKYFAIDTLKDTSWIEVYYGDFGRQEYIRFKSKSADREWYKNDSIQYEKSAEGYFESPEKRSSDVPTEQVVSNSTSRLGNGAYHHKPMNKKFKANKKYKNLVGGFCWTYLNGDSGKVDCDVLYYYGVPIDIRIYGREKYKYRIVRAEIIDTNMIFPLVLKLK